MNSDPAPADVEQPTTTGTLGCGLLIAVANSIVMGLIAATFAAGPYSSVEQERWYRCGSIAFLSLGAVAPAIYLLFGARRSPARVASTIGWMVVVWIPFLGYLLLSGGGV